MLPALQEFGDFGPVVAQGVVELQELVLLAGRPLLVPDGAVEVVVVSLTALLPVPVRNLILLLQQPRYLGPLLHASLLVQFLQSAVFLHSPLPTFGVQAFLSVIQPIYLI